MNIPKTLLALLLFATISFGAEVDKIFESDDVAAYKSYAGAKEISPLELFVVVNENRRDISNHDYTMLSLAVKHKSLKIVKWILQNLSKDELKSIYVQKMLQEVCEASSSDDTKMAELFLEFDVGVEYADDRGYTTLMSAARNSTPSVVKKILAKGASPYKTYYNGSDALAFAMNRGDARIAVYLLDNYQYDLNKTFEHRYLTSYVPMLKIFTYDKENLAVLEKTLNGIDDKLIKKDGEKLLKDIIDNKEAIAVAAKNRAFKELFDEKIYSYLYYAYKDRYEYQGTNYLGTKDILAKAKKQIADYESYIKADDAKTRIQKIKATGEKLFPLIEAHTRYDEMTSGKDSKLYAKELGEYLLVVAAYRGDTKTMQKLIEGGVKVNFHINLDKQALRVLYPINPMLAAAKNKQYESVKLLLQNGADINISDWYHQNALVYALDGATAKDKPLVELLLKSGIDANVEFDEYRRALSEVYYRPLSFALIFTPELDIVKLVAQYADKSLPVGQDHTHITNWLNEWHLDRFNLTCERFAYALFITPDRQNISYHNDTVLTYITNSYDNNERSPYNKCSQNDLLNIYFGTDKAYSQEDIERIAKDEQNRIKVYTYKRDFAQNLLDNGELDLLYELIKQTKDLTTLAKSKNISFLYEVLTKFESWTEIIGYMKYALLEIDDKEVLKALQDEKSGKFAEISKRLKLSKKDIADLRKNQKLLAIAKLLIEKGADVNQPDSIFTSETPFEYVSEYQDIHPEFVELAELMKKYGAKK